MLSRIRNEGRHATTTAIGYCVSSMYSVLHSKEALPTLPSVMDHRASHTGSTCLVEALISMARIIATSITIKLNEKIAATASFCLPSVRSPWRRDSSRIITRGD